jgi:hypothetical protein
MLTHNTAEWSGINALLYYGPTLVQSIGLHGDTVSLVVSGGIGVVQFIAVVPAILYIDRLGMFIIRVYLPSAAHQCFRKETAFERRKFHHGLVALGNCYARV